jgi:ABC-type microcin C transport system duplicated ATPase subunit YejF
MTQAVLSIQGLTVALPAGGDRAHAVQSVSLQIEAGRTLCVVGEQIGDGHRRHGTARQSPQASGWRYFAQR